MKAACLLNIDVLGKGKWTGLQLPCYIPCYTLNITGWTCNGSFSTLCNCPVQLCCGETSHYKSAPTDLLCFTQRYIVLCKSFKYVWKITVKWGCFKKNNAMDWFYLSINNFQKAEKEKKKRNQINIWCAHPLPWKQHKFPLVHLRIRTWQGGCFKFKIELMTVLLRI